VLGERPIIWNEVEELEGSDLYKVRTLRRGMDDEILTIRCVMELVPGNPFGGIWRVRKAGCKSAGFNVKEQ
jgi:hypothetical protein